MSLLVHDSALATRAEPRAVAAIVVDVVFELLALVVSLALAAALAP